MSDTSSPDQIADAQALCEKHGGLFIEASTDAVWDREVRCYRYPRCWKVWRRLPGGRAAFLGSRRDPAQLLRLVKKLV